MNNELLKIRKVKSEDARHWFILINKVWRDAYHHIFPEEVFIEKEKSVDDKIKDFSNRIKNDNENIAYVAEYDGEIIGIMCGTIHSPYQRFNAKYADLGALYIDPKFQKLGIGSKFRKIFEEWATENGATQYVVGCLKDNIKARKVYESWGGILSDYETSFVKNSIEYPEVFYTYKLKRHI